jgi:hypothetical protein
MDFSGMIKMNAGIQGDGRQVPFSQGRKGERRTPNAERRTPNAERRTPNAERRTSNVEQKRRKKQTEGVIFLSSVRRWKFDVRCWMFAFPERSAALSGLRRRKTSRRKRREEEEALRTLVLSLGAQRSSVLERSGLVSCGLVSS